MTNKPPSNRQYVLDTNVLISDPTSLIQFDEHTIVISMTVLEELDRIKDSRSPRHEMASKDARLAIQSLKLAINGATPDEMQSGIPMDNGGTLRVLNDINVTNEQGSDTLDFTVPDNRIIATALHLQKTEPNKRTVLVTKDINLQLKGRVAGLDHVEDYLNEKQIDDIAYLACGYLEIDFNPMDKLDDESRCENSTHGSSLYFLKKSIFGDLAGDLYLNQYIYQKGGLPLALDMPNEVYRIEEITLDEVRLRRYNTKQIMKRKAFGIQPRSLLQGLALDALLDPHIDLVQLTGPAGSGKTLLALAAAFEQSSVGDDADVKNRYDKIIVTRTATDMAEDIGFLPGTEEEKMAPWLAAISDSMEVLFKPGPSDGNTPDKMGAMGSEHSIKHMTERANLQYKSVNFMRGRNLVRTFFLLDESQNTTPHIARSLITRAGMGTKVVVLGNLGQIDARYVTPLTSGLTHVVEKMKHYGGGATMLLPGGERSVLSAYAEENL
jgi:PhoH-like ATPase